MLSSSVRNLLFALVASAISATATLGLSLKVTGPSAVNDAPNLTVSATLTNTGNETLKVLKDPLSPISNMSTDTFRITNVDGVSPSFIGVRAKFVPQRAVELGGYIILAPGESKTVEHDLSAVYNFSDSGEGTYDIETRNVFQIVNEDSTLQTIYASAEALTAQVVGPLTITTPPPGALSKLSANAAARAYVANVISYITSHTTSTLRFTIWFGPFTPAKRTTLLSHFSSISTTLSSPALTYDCTCTESGIYAYVYPDTYGIFYLCGAFWTAPVTGTDSQAGTLIHEASHFTRNGGTSDYVYGQSAARTLATRNPQAIMNAGNHEYFAENNPAQS